MNRPPIPDRNRFPPGKTLLPSAFFLRINPWTMNPVTYNDAENTSWYQISSPAFGWVRKQDLLV